jgi:hypothetical protein
VPELLVTALFEALTSDAASEPFALGEDLKVSPAAHRTYEMSAYRGASTHNRRLVDFVAAFACHAVEAGGSCVIANSGQ